MKKDFNVILHQPLNFKENLRFLNRSEEECMHIVIKESIRKWMKFEDRDYIFDIILADEEALSVRLNEGITERAGQAVKNYIREWLDLDRDLRPFYELGEKDALLAPLCHQFRNLRIVGIPDLFEALCWSVIGQQINLRFAYTLKKRMVQEWGASFIFDKTVYYHFPQPEAIASLQVSDFSPMQFSRRKAEYIIGIARLLADGELTKSGLEKESSAKIAETLLSIRGIGHWSAQYVLMKCFLRTDAFPIGDAGLHNAIKSRQNRLAKPAVEEIAGMAKAWNGWEAYATFYLWQSLLEEK